jgi:probable phosphoglycerate mutase
MSARKVASQTNLFASERRTREAHTSSTIVAYIDGGARGNPGPAGYGVVITNASGEIVAELSKYLGQRTNNFAEYSGLLAALEFTLSHNYESLNVVSDSELLVRQIRGIYKVRSPELKQLYEQARLLIGKLHDFHIEHVRREKNKQADKLANQAMDEGL